MSYKIRIAYDISLLGSGHVSNQSRTGIFRVLEEIILELSQRDAVLVNSLSLNKESTTWDDISSLLYCKNEQPALLSNFKITHSRRKPVMSVLTALVNLQKTLISASASRKSLQYKAGRALQILGSRLAQCEASIFAASDDYDIYHGSYFPLPDVDTLLSVPRVLTIYDLIPVLYPQFVIPKIYQRTVEMLKSINIHKDWIICISEHTKRDFCQYTGMNLDRVFVIPLAASDYFYPVKDLPCMQRTLDKYGIPKDPYILSLCTLEPRKNIDMLIRAFSDLVQAYPETELNLVLVGISGWKNNEIFKAVRNNVLVKSRIFFTGYLPDQDLAPIYSKAVAFVYPSLYEGFGLPPLEAMQCGTPVITSNSSSLPEVVGDAGILIDPKNQSELSHAIWQLVNDSELRSRLSQKSLARAKQFSWKKCVDKTIEVYKIAISHKK